MGMRGSRQLVLLGAVVALGATAVPAEAATTCGLAGSKTIVRTSTARVFSKKGRLPLSGGGSVTGDRVYGCLYERGRRTLLALARDVDGDSEWVDRRTIRLAGPFAGYAHGFDSGLDGGEFVEVRDLRTGKRVYRTDDNSLVDVRDLELGASGSVAWISEQVDSPSTRGVFAWSLDQGLLTLDSGAQIGSRSLTLQGTTLSWLMAGAPRSAPLPG
jgi:hypothetical protein